ncbi:Helitron helicase-like domain, partial [Cinara cedri]
MLHHNNPNIKDLKTTLERVLQNSKNFEIIIHADNADNAHRGRYNAPTTSEVSLVIVGQQFEKRDIIEAKTKLPLQKTVSASQFYSYHIMIRQTEINHLLYLRSLFNQYLVDMYAKIETERLNFIKNNQIQFRADNYIHLRDAIGRQDTYKILPILDAMTYVRHYGRPDLFITFTCNPRWKEVSNASLSKQKSYDRHNIIARIFHLKVKTLMILLTKGNLFGEVQCFMYSVEWQKRGLPHIHILLWLKQRISPDKLDCIISAEIPDPEKDSLLYDIIKANMIHGPCGNSNNRSPCMDSDSKKYPRPFIQETQTGDAGIQ